MGEGPSSGASLPSHSARSSAPDPSPSPIQDGESGVADVLEAYVEGRFASEDEALRSIRRTIEEEGLPPIQLPAVTGRVVQWLLRLIAARRVVEVGTLAGYSALWIARALPDDLEEGEGLVTLEIDPARSAIARRLLAKAGVGDRVDVRVGDAAELLPALGPNGAFDAVFLDADKEKLTGYIPEARRLLRPGGLLLIDNALWKGRVADPTMTDPATEGIRASHESLQHDPSFDTTILPVGDGLLVARRRQRRDATTRAIRSSQPRR